MIADNYLIQAAEMEQIFYYTTFMGNLHYAVLPYIKDFLGHSSIDSTSIYAHADNEAMAAAFRSVDQEALPEKDSNGNVVSYPEKKWKGKEESWISN